MLIAFGYAYPNKVVSFAGGISVEDPYWVSYNQRADADGATAKEGSANNCLRTRFLNAIPNYTFFDFDQQYLPQSTITTSSSSSIRRGNPLRIGPQLIAQPHVS